MLHLGGKAFGRVLSRISTALAQFIKPVSTPDSSLRGFEKFQNPKKQEQQSRRPSAEIIPFPEKKNPPPPPMTPEPSHPFLLLFTLLQGQQGRMMHWLGTRAYRSAVPRKSRLLKKGAMLDQKAE